MNILPNSILGLTSPQALSFTHLLIASFLFVVSGILGVFLYLKNKASKAPEVDDHAPQSRQLIEEPPSRPPKILITDDQKEYRNMIATYLRKRGYEVEEKSHGEGAVEKIREWKPQVVLMDLNMPGMSGFEACRQARLAESESRTRIVAVSGLSGKGLHERCLASGIDRFVSKPLDLPHLEAVIEEQLAVLPFAA